MVFTVKEAHVIIPPMTYGDSTVFPRIILLNEKFLQFDWLRGVVFQLNLKYLHVKITNLCGVVV